VCTAPPPSDPYTTTLKKLLNIREGIRRGRNAVTADRLGVPPDVELESADPAGQHLVRYDRAGPQILFGLGIAIEEQSVALAGLITLVS